MYYFENDYGEMAHPRIFEAMMKYNLDSETGYYGDNHSEKARELIREELGAGDEVEIHFAPGGTLANVIAISSFLRPYQAVIATRDAHVFTHETGAIEAVGHKVLSVKTADGKITPEEIQPLLDEHQGEHMVEPKLVFISNATEIGTIYTKAEIIALSEFCKKNKLLLYCDGARLGSALTSKYNDLKIADLVKYTDAFYIGGTKNGALLGEAIIIVNPDLRAGFRHMSKQKGGLLAKGKIIGLQFEELFKDNLFYELGRKENEAAEKIVDALKEKGYSFLTEPQSNQIFPIIPNEKAEKLEKDFRFIRWEKVDDDHVAIRLVTSWATSGKAVEAIIKAL